MNSQRIYLTIFQLLLLFVVCSAQNTSTPSEISLQASKEDVSLIQNRTLLIELYGTPEIDTDVTEMLIKFWNFNQNFIFVSKESIVGILKDNESKYAVLAIDKVIATDKTQYGSYINSFFRFSVKLGEKYNKYRPVFYQDVDFHIENDKPILAKRDIAFAINFIQNHFRARKEGKLRIGTFYHEIKENMGKLETKTLLLDKMLMDKKLQENDIPANYTFQYKVSDQKEIENAIMTNDNRYAYVEIVPIGGGYDVKLHFVVDCETGLILSYGDFFNGAFDKFSNMINDKHLHNYEKHSHGKKKKAKTKSENK